MARERTPAQSPSPVPSTTQRKAGPTSTPGSSRRASSVASVNQTGHRSNSPSWAALAAGAVNKVDDPVRVQDLVGLTGARLRVTVTGAPDRVYEGSLYCCDPTIGLLALECPSGKVADYRLIRVASVKSFEIVAPAPTEASVPTDLKPVSMPTVQAVEAAAVRADEQRAFRLAPKGVGRLGQEIFDALGKTLPVRWAQATIVVMDEVIITSPYDVGNCQTPQSEGADRTRLDRVRKVLEGERTRLLRLYPELESQATS